MEAYKSLDKIAEQISAYIDQLQSGTLLPDQIDDLLKEVAQLQERLIILRYKAYEASVKHNAGESDEPRLQVPFHIETRPAEEPPQQISLIDAIAEVQRMEQDPVADMAAAKPVNDPAPQSIPVSAPSEPLFSREAAHEISLAEKLHKTPITDLRKSISLNQKFIFINELFRQNADEFHAAIERLNNFDDLEEAMRFIKENLFPAFDWDKEDKNVEVFLDLVERRYL